MSLPRHRSSLLAYLRFARVGERAALEALQWRSSLVWPETRAALRAHPDAIAIPIEQLRERRVRLAEIGGHVVGFAAIVPLRANVAELDGLFVEPDCMGRGIGRVLMTDAIRLARRRGARTMEVTAGRAEGFYAKLGFVSVRPIATRFAPAVRMRLRLA
jgi:GNAT superfamily N-acetyltransferase